MFIYEQNDSSPFYLYIIKERMKRQSEKGNETYAHNSLKRNEETQREAFGGRLWADVLTSLRGTEREQRLALDVLKLYWWLFILNIFDPPLTSFIFQAYVPLHCFPEAYNLQSPFLLSLNTCIECLMLPALCKARGIQGGVKTAPLPTGILHRGKGFESWLIRPGEGRRGYFRTRNSSKSEHGLHTQTLDGSSLLEPCRRPEERCYPGNSASLCFVGCLRKTCYIEFIISSESLLPLPFNSNPKCFFSCS